MQKVTLRFYVASLTEHAGGHYTALLQPSYANGVNSDWSKATPTGKIELTLSTEGGVEFYQEALRNKSTVGIEMFVVEDQPKV